MRPSVLYCTMAMLLNTFSLDFHCRRSQGGESALYVNGGSHWCSIALERYPGTTTGLSSENICDQSC